MNLACASTETNTGGAQVLPFEPHHIQYLEHRAVVPDWAAEAGLRSVSPDVGVRLLGRDQPLPCGGIAIPYPNAPGYVRIRLDEGKPRYLAPAGREVPIFIPPGCEFEGSAPLYVVESPGKALVLQDNGFNAIGLGGIYSTLTKDHKLNDSWNVVGLVRREVVITFDAGRALNPDVARAEARLAIALEQHGAKVKVAALPLRDDGEDQGPDDFRASNGYVDLRRVLAADVPADPVERVKNISAEQAVNLLGDLPFLWSLTERGVATQKKVMTLLRPHGVRERDLQRALYEAEQKAKNRRIHEEETPAGAFYAVRREKLCLVSSPDGGVTENCQPLGNFTAHIVEEEILDDGAEKTRAFVIEGALETGVPLSRVRVSPQELGGELWPSQKWGAKPIVYPGIPRVASHLRAAIQTVSSPTETVTYMHSGFRDHGGRWIYLHAGGAVGAHDVSIELEAAYRRYKLPAFAEDPREAVKISLDFLKTADTRVTLPLLCAVYRAPLQSSHYFDAVLMLHGKSGSMKSSLAALAQSHWGEFDHASLPLSWGWTFSAIELYLHRMKDALVTIDDFAPKSADATDETHKKGAQLVRHVGNGSSRGRLKSDCTARPDRPCRALVLSTGEDLPKGESIQARLVAIHMSKEDINLDALTRLQANAHRLPHAMAAYVEWLIPQMPQLEVEVKKKFQELRDEMQQKYGHLRAPAAMAHLLVGAYYFTEFAKDLGVMSDEDAKGYIDEARAALLANYREQVRATEQSNPGHRFLEVLRDLLLRRKVTLQSMGMPLTSASSDGTEPVGWKDKTHAYLLPDAAFEAVNKALKSMNEGTPLQQYGLWSRMVEEGLILPNGKEPTHRLDVDGDRKRERVLKIDLTKLRGEPDPDGSGDGGPGPGGGEPGPDDDGGALCEGGDDGLDLPSLWRPIRSPAENMNGSAPLTIASLPPSPVLAVQMPGSCPDRSGHGCEGPGDGKTPADPGDMQARTGNQPHSDQMTRSFRGESPSVSADVARLGSVSPSLSGAPLPSEKIWSSGQAGQGASFSRRSRSPEGLQGSGQAEQTSDRAGPGTLAEAILRAGRVGLVVHSTGPDITEGPVLVALALPDGQARVFHTLGGEELGPVADALCQVTIVGHDLKGALAQFQYHLGFMPGTVVDTAIAWRLLDGGRHLKNHKYFSLERALGKQIVQKNIDWSTAPSPELRDELAEEARDVLRLADIFQKDLQEERLEEVAALEFKLLPIVAQMEVSGVPINRVEWERLVDMWTSEAAELEKNLVATLGVKNIDNNEEVLAALHRLGLQVERTNSEALAPYMHLPVAQQLVLYRRNNGFVTGAGNGVLRAFSRSEDGRVHATLNQIGAVTGRLSAQEPNLLGLPRDKQVRSCIQAPAGKKLVVGDYNAIELRVLADQTGDEKLKEVFGKSDGDPHRHTASLLMNVPENQVTDEQRNRAKPVNFGGSFGMGVNKLIAYAKKNYKVDLRPEQAAQFKQMFLQNHAGVAAWQKKMAEEMPAELRTKSGRVSYYFDPAEDYNARLAFPIQGTAADGMKQAMVLLAPHLKRLGAQMILAVHDELLVEAPEEHAEEVKVLMRDSMIAGMKKYVPSVPIVVEPKVMSRWEK
ncbi:DNA polymerase [Polyangium mundeleinium]|uniref:DNA-directed DNA polymerase n=1 Tax=Polyangium mundeleinium TaxID=2995306 RepID=A0ABT5EHE8_9BACT|nr:DNA polymerase [Polyangium mundeleinium]MDC0740919.1 DNA polymerase [Polyangium mundeleinium]